MDSYWIYANNYTAILSKEIQKSFWVGGGEGGQESQ